MKLIAKLSFAISSVATLFLTVGCTQQAENARERHDELASQDTFKKNRIVMVFTNHTVAGGVGESVQTTGYTLTEAAEPYYAFVQAGYSVDFVSPKGGAVTPDNIDLSTQTNKMFWEDTAMQSKLKRTLKPEDIKVGECLGLFFVGGHGAMWDFPNNEGIIKLTQDIYENRGGVVGAVCHGPAALTNVKLSTGQYLVQAKKVAAFSNKEEEVKGMDGAVPFLLENSLKARGAQVVVAPPDSINVQVADRLVTGQNKPSAKKTAEEMVRLLNEIGAR